MSSEGALRDRDDADFELIETLRWEPDAGFVRLDRHLARLYASANTLGFTLDSRQVGEALREAQGERVQLRVRLTLARSGQANASTMPFEPFPDGIVWRIAIAGTRLQSGDPLLRHKTTQRSTYDAARAELPRETADEMILLNERGEVCEGTITSLFVDRGDRTPLLTPSLGCGLLDGVLRGEMLANGDAVEGIVTLEALHRAKAILVGNSLRGLIPARLDTAVSGVG